ncbi:golvesin C-terminal-like domain-containing protein [Salinithrix halophila]|uniref:Golvesin/Xly CBD-like domain-containing protein n=1 Tax=Salinithrix halophila TaxID=1485204 RepID=A0ABV8JIE9_9BACL
MRRWIKRLFPVLFLGGILFAMIGFRHLDRLDASEARVIEEFRERWMYEADGPALAKAKEVYRGDWSLSTNAQGYFGPDYQAHPQGDGRSTFTWIFMVKRPGTYKVFVNYAAEFDRASNAPYTIEYNGGQRAVRQVDQRTGGGNWVSLGTYTYKRGEKGKVTLSNQADGFVIADAIKLVHKDDPSAKLILDNRNPQNGSTVPTTASAR